MEMNGIEKPAGLKGAASTPEYGSDALAQVLSTLEPGIEYIALNPGSSYRGLHDSLVNFTANRGPQMLLCLHEEHTVAIAHGYAKVTDRPMGAAVHANVGLQHAIMAIYNAFCDRVPMVILGAGGPFDSTERRPWIDWIHTSGDQAAMIRPFIKWDDQPASLNAALHSIVRANYMTMTKPWAPTYVCFDVTLQERKVTAADVNLPDPARYIAGRPAGLAAEDLDAASDLLQHAKRPLFLIGRVKRDEAAWQHRIELVETLGAAVVTDLKNAAAFPYPHRRQPAPPSTFLHPVAGELIRAADVIVALDWIDLAGTFKLAFGGKDGATPDGKVVTASLDQGLHNGWVKDSGALPPADLPLTVDADRLLEALHERIVQGKTSSNGVSAESSWPPAAKPRDPIPSLDSSPNLFQSQFAKAIYEAVSVHPFSMIRVNLGWQALDMRADHPLSYLGSDGGAGIASGPGMTVGAALALLDKETGRPTRLPVAILGDGDTLMGNSALWTAAHYRIPLLIIVANNVSFYNDEVHQERVARTRSRPVENKWIGMSTADPQPHLCNLARSLGLVAPAEQVTDPRELPKTLAWAVDQVMKEGKPVLVDVLVRPDGYGSAP